EYQVPGSKEPPEVVVRTGNVKAKVRRDGPAWTIRVCAPVGKSSVYSLLVRMPGQPEQVVTGTLLHTEWDVKFYPRTDPIRRPALLAGIVVGNRSGNALTALAAAGCAL